MGKAHNLDINETKDFSYNIHKCTWSKKFVLLKSYKAQLKPTILFIN